MSAASLRTVRDELRGLLKNFSRKEVSEKTEEQAHKDEAAYAATGLKSSDIADRIRAVEFLEILGDNPFAQDYLLLAINDKEGSVVQKALHALGKVADRRSIPKLQNLAKNTTSKHLTNEIARIIGKIERKAQI
jgi:HEAT repeat protein